jgi:hypothetical protein
MRGFAESNVWFVDAAIWRRRPISIDDQSCAVRHGTVFRDGAASKPRVYLNAASGPLAFPEGKVVAWQSAVDEGLFAGCTVDFDRLDESNSIVRAYFYEDQMKDLLPSDLAGGGAFVESDAIYMCKNFGVTLQDAVSICRFVRTADEPHRADIRTVRIERKDAWIAVGETTFSLDAVRDHGAIYSSGLVLRGDVAEQIRSYWDDEYFVWKKLV